MNIENEKFFKSINQAWPWIGFFAIALWVIQMAGYGLDNTDASATNRSGMSLHRDNLTGCEYLSTKNGGITPRLTSAGIHMGCRS
jgi:hypothetical protein